jgi:hypothetical protein
VLANGLNLGLRHALGIERKIVSRGHSISIRFDLAPVGRAAFDFQALTYFSERPGDRIPYITLFPVGARMRANLFVYREVDDPWLREFRRTPRETLNAALPRLQKITGEFDVAGDVKIRPADLYVSSGHRQAGIVLVGDAFETTCPVTGTDKVFTEVERLCNVHIPAWLSTDGMGAEKIAALLEPAALGAVLLVVRRRFSAPHARALQRGAKALPSLLLVVLILIVVFIVVIGLTGRAMRVAALIVPGLAIGAVARKQFGV